MRVIKRNIEKVWGARYTLGARYLPKNTVYTCTAPDISFVVNVFYTLHERDYYN
jgi:hypothetical protein